MKEKKFVNLANARPGIYEKVIKNIQESSICPFCEEHIRDIHKNPLVEKEFWYVTDNMYPYKPTKEHLLLIHKKHIEHVSDLSKEAWEELFKIIKEETKKRNMEGGTFLMRFGNTKYTGASVSHLHCNLLQSDPENPEYEKAKGVITRVG